VVLAKPVVVVADILSGVLTTVYEVTVNAAIEVEVVNTIVADEAAEPNA
jgi:hypothetical protein